MELRGLALTSRERLPSGVMLYILHADPDFAVWGRKRPKPWKMPHPYPLAVEGLMFRSLANIRRDFPYLFLFTNDVPSGARAETHLEYAARLYDAAFMNRFPHATVHIDLGQFEETSFLAGPTVFSRLFDIGREDISYLWPAMINDCNDQVAYYLLFASQRVPLEKLADAVEQSKSRAEFDSVVLDRVDVMAAVFELLALYVYAEKPSVIAQIDSALTPEGETAASGGSAPG